MPQFIDRTGERFGNWTVIKRAENKGKRTRWLVECDCGALRIYRIDALQEGRAKGCRECTRTLRHSYPDLYNIWRGMNGRCTNSRYNEFKHYGGRGIKVCDRWKNSFKNFVDDMGERPSAKHSIDRIDNDGNYCPENCRWATYKEQSRNTRQNVFVEFDGESLTVTDLASLLGIPRHLLYQRLGRGYSIDEAITKPSDKSKSRYSK